MEGAACISQKGVEKKAVIGQHMPTAAGTTRICVFSRTSKPRFSVHTRGQLRCKLFANPTSQPFIDKNKTEEGAATKLKGTTNKNHHKWIEFHLASNSTWSIGSRIGKHLLT